MESAIRGLVLDSSVLVAAERAKLTTPEVLRNIRASADVEFCCEILLAGLAQVGDPRGSLIRDAVLLIY